MKHNTIFLLLIALLLSPVGIYAMEDNHNSGIVYRRTQANKSENQLLISLKIDFSKLNLQKQQMVTITPIMISSDKSFAHHFEPIVMAGRARNRALNRALQLGDYKFKVNPQRVIREGDHNYQQLDLVLSVPYQSWMNNAQLIMNEEISGCANCNITQNDYIVMSPIITLKYDPSFLVIYVSPEVEEVKQRSQNYSANLNFQVGKYDIHYNFGNNTEVLADVDRIIKDIQNDENLTVNHLKVTGYASPDGNYESNMRLSENRARSFVNYLRQKYHMDGSPIEVQWKGEDWEGLRKIVESSQMEGRESIIKIIDNEFDIAKRKRALQLLSGGSIYRNLLDYYYPQLRRNEYTIGYISRAFNVNEAKELIKTKPYHLSLNEMFAVANSYPKNSNEFKEVFDIAARVFPNDPIAQLNSATMEIENGEYKSAIARLTSIDMPEAWNNIGVAYAKINELKKAEAYLKKAEAAGVAAAIENLKELANWQNAQ